MPGWPENYAAVTNISHMTGKPQDAPTLNLHFQTEPTSYRGMHSSLTIHLLEPLTVPYVKTEAEPSRVPGSRLTFPVFNGQGDVKSVTKYLL